MSVTAYAEVQKKKSKLLKPCKELRSLLYLFVVVRKVPYHYPWVLGGTDDFPRVELDLKDPGGWRVVTIVIIVIVVIVVIIICTGLLVSRCVMMVIVVRRSWSLHNWWMLLKLRGERMICCWAGSRVGRSNSLSLLGKGVSWITRRSFIIGILSVDLLQSFHMRQWLADDPGAISVLLPDKH